MAACLLCVFFISTAGIVVDLLKTEADGTFQNSLSKAETVSMLEAFLAAKNALEGANVTYWMNGGTLLGSYRHHGPIPWDDDIDLLVRGADKPAAYKALTALAPQYQLYVYLGDIYQPTAWRFYPSDGARIRVHTFWSGWRFPMVDLMFYQENSTHVWSESYDNEQWPKSNIFPLQLRPFGDLWAPSPCDVLGHLLVDYPNLTECQTTKISHRTYRWKARVKAVECSQLEGLHPFVHREQGQEGGMARESLMMGRDTIQQVTLTTGCRPSKDIKTDKRDPSVLL
jgi:hypothetical protein